MKRNLLVALYGVACAVVLMACAHKIEVYEYKQDSVLDHVFVRKGIDFSIYDAVVFDEISVWHPRENGPAPERVAQIQANLARTQEIFDATLAEALGDRYTIRNRPVKRSRGTLRVEVQFIDLRTLPPGSPLPTDLTRLQFRTAPGHITMVARLFDARSGELLARAADLGKRASAGGKAVVDWEDIASDFTYWARVFRAWLDQSRKDGGA